MTSGSNHSGGLALVRDDLFVSVAFLTRLPAAWLGFEPIGRPDFKRASRMFPIVGALVGVCGALVLLISAFVGVPPLVAAFLAVAATILVTGGLHEDGLADTFDGFGGYSVERKLEIMRDSHIGTYGTAAVILSVAIRGAAIAALLSWSVWAAGLALVAAEAASRASLVRLWYDLPPADSRGLAWEAGPPNRQATFTAQILAIAIALATIWPSAGIAAAVVGILLSAATAYIFRHVVFAQLGGRTGDTLGACQQITAAAFLVGVAAAI